ncbi:MAG: heparinase II/III family protein, partial [Actinomycetia bacterium]|nr:heparinase II/III family protein [Actinomycetes bacterium]
MSAAEIGGRTSDHIRQLVWARQRVAPGQRVEPPRSVLSVRPAPAPVPDSARGLVPGEAGKQLVTAADRLLAGDWYVLGTRHPNPVDPDWFYDPITCRTAPQHDLAFRIDQRDERITGNVKAVWELSRHQHLSVLAGAWWLTRKDDYATVLAAQLRSWWEANPFLSGVHWTSGIEVGLRLVSWAWIRRLLDGWPGVQDLFDDNPLALTQIWWHQRYLAAFASRGSSANNHIIAEACGRLVGSCAFDWYVESDRWRAQSARRLEAELAANTFDSGVNRELATDYHGFVTELGLVAMSEAAAAGYPLSTATSHLLVRSLDAAAAMTDVTGRPPRQGDSDEGRALVVDDPDSDPWATLLAVGDAMVGRRTWWPDGEARVAATILGAFSPRLPAPVERPKSPPQRFEDAGMVLLRTSPADGPEIWCRCDGGPHGFLSIAAHAHADALSVEVRYDGVDVLADPGTYCYHGEPLWRSYFRSTRAHNTVEIDDSSQCVEGGPFLWTSHSNSTILRTRTGARDAPSFRATHDGYTQVDPPVLHERTVELDRSTRRLSITDDVTGKSQHRVRVAFHLGPQVGVRLSGSTAELAWRGATGAVRATLYLPARLNWSEHRGETDPVVGWFSPRLGLRVPTTTLLGATVADDNLN